MSRLSVAMIVKDEVGSIEQAVKSVAGIADEIVVADTGSTDGTIELLEHLGVRLIHLPWEGSFASARNAVKEAIRGSFILSLDGDEVVSVGGPLVLPEGTAAYEVERRSYVSSTDPQYRLRRCAGQYGEELYYPAYISEPNILLFRNIPGLEWRGAVHESLAGSIEDLGITELAPFPGLVVHNYGRERRREEKLAAYSSLVQRRLQEDPSDPASWFYVGLQKELAGDHLGGADSYLRSLRLKKTPYAQFGLSMAYMRSSQHGLAEISLVEYLRHDPMDSNAWMSLLVCAFQRDDMDRLDYYLGMALASGSPTKSDFIRFAQYAAQKRSYHSKSEQYGKLLEKITNS